MCSPATRCLTMGCDTASAPSGCRFGRLASERRIHRDKGWMDALLYFRRKILKCINFTREKKPGGCLKISAEVIIEVKGAACSAPLAKRLADLGAAATVHTPQEGCHADWLLMHTFCLTSSLSQPSLNLGPWHRVQAVITGWCNDGKGRQRLRETGEARGLRLQSSSHLK